MHVVLLCALLATTYGRLHIDCTSCTESPKGCKQSTSGLTSHYNYPRILASPIFVRRRYSGRRYLYCSNAVATTQFLLLRRSGNVELNPWPQKTGLSASKSICSFCEKVLKRNQNGVECLACARGFHVKCSGMRRKELASYRKNAMSWTCFP